MSLATGPRIPRAGGHNLRAESRLGMAVVELDDQQVAATAERGGGDLRSAPASLPNEQLAAVMPGGAGRAVPLIADDLYVRRAAIARILRLASPGSSNDAADPTHAYAMRRGGSVLSWANQSAVSRSIGGRSRTSSFVRLSRTPSSTRSTAPIGIATLFAPHR
jgi:hypothetical protein